MIERRNICWELLQSTTMKSFMDLFLVMITKNIFANADFKNNPKKFKGKRVKFVPDYNNIEEQHPRATEISTLGKDTITLVAVLDIESSEPYPQDIGKTLKVMVEREIDKLKTIEGTTITGTVSVGRQL